MGPKLTITRLTTVKLTSRPSALDVTEVVARADCAIPATANDPARQKGRAKLFVVMRQFPVPNIVFLRVVQTNRFVRPVHIWRRLSDNKIVAARSMLIEKIYYSCVVKYYSLGSDKWHAN